MMISFLDIKHEKMKHSGTYDYHDDDCWCVMGGGYCNRDGFVWSCCGATKKDSECSGDKMHPTYWNHPKFLKTISDSKNKHSVYKSNKEIRQISPESFK